MPELKRGRDCWRCDEQTLHTKHGTAHLVHFLLSIVTCGLWVILWVAAAISNSTSPWICSRCGSRS